MTEPHDLLRWLHAEAAHRVTQLEAELGDIQHDLALRAFTAPDADFDTMLSSLDARVADLVAGRDAERSSRQAWAAEAMRLELAYDEVEKTLREEIAWQKHAYRDGKDKVAVGRTIGMEDALRTLQQLFGVAGLASGFSRPVRAVHRQARVFQVGSTEPTDVLCVRSRVNHVVFQHWPNWGKWRAMEDSGGDGNFYAWHRLNAGPDGAEMVEVVERVPGSPWVEGGEKDG